MLCLILLIRQKRVDRLLRVLNYIYQYKITFCLQTLPYMHIYFTVTNNVQDLHQGKIILNYTLSPFSE